MPWVAIGRILQIIRILLFVVVFPHETVPEIRLMGMTHRHILCPVPNSHNALFCENRKTSQGFKGEKNGLADQSIQKTFSEQPQELRP